MTALTLAVALAVSAALCLVDITGVRAPCRPPLGVRKPAPPPAPPTKAAKSHRVMP